MSVSRARCFVTFVTEKRIPSFRDESSVAAVLSVLGNWHAENDGSILTAVVMPDHVHVLFELGDRLTVGQCVGRWKTSVRRLLHYSTAWQRDFWEHRLRPDESIEDYGLYIFLNPYRAGLVPAPQAAFRWWAPAPDRFLFIGRLRSDGTPPPEWLGWTDEHFSHLATGD